MKVHQQQKRKRHRNDNAELLFNSNVYIDRNDRSRPSCFLQPIAQSSDPDVIYNRSVTNIVIMVNRSINHDSNE